MCVCVRLNQALRDAQNVCALTKEPEKQPKEGVNGIKFHSSKYMKSMNTIRPE